MKNERRVEKIKDTNDTVLMLNEENVSSLENGASITWEGRYNVSYYSLFMLLTILKRASCCLSQSRYRFCDVQYSFLLMIEWDDEQRTLLARDVSNEPSLFSS